jgi:hypothetical protein
MDASDLPAASASSSSNPQPRQNKRKPPSRAGWTPDEDDKIQRAFREYGNEGTKAVLAKIGDLQGRTNDQITQRWRRVINPEITKGCWTRKEDDTIRRWAKKHPKKWTELAQFLPGRTGKQCRERWENHLDPTNETRPWTAAEDEIVIALHATSGNKWTDIASYLPGRKDNAVKNRWNSTLAKRIQRGEDGEPVVHKRSPKERPLELGGRRNAPIDQLSPQPGHPGDELFERDIPITGLMKTGFEAQFSSGSSSQSPRRTEI